MKGQSGVVAMTDAEAQTASAAAQRAEQLRRLGWQRFDSADFAGAVTAFAALSDLDLIGEPELEALVEMLLDRGDRDTAIDALNGAIDRRLAEADTVVPLAWLTERFDLVAGGMAETEQRRLAALQLLEGLAAAGDADAWTSTLSEERCAAVERSFVTPLELLDALEQEAYAPPETAFPERAAAKVEELGHLSAGEPRVARAAERLLHALGQSSAAYRVERARRAAAARSAILTREPAHAEEVDLFGLTIVLAGGHPALRAMIERDLEHSGAARVRAIPSAKEASRAGRDVQAALAGADLVVLLVRQLAHSTSDQVRRAAARADVPVITAESSGIGGVRRAIERHLRERSG